MNEIHLNKNQKTPPLRSPNNNKIIKSSNNLEINFGIRKENFNYLHLIINNEEKKM